MNCNNCILILTKKKFYIKLFKTIPPGLLRLIHISEEWEGGYILPYILPIKPMDKRKMENEKGKQETFLFSDFSLFFIHRFPLPVKN